MTTRGRIWDGGELGRDAESAERLPSTEGRRRFGGSREGRLILSPVEGPVGLCRDVGDLARVGEEGESGRWLVLADPRVVPNRREGGDGDSGASRWPRCLGVSIESRRHVVVGVCVTVGFGFKAFSPVVSLDDRLGVSALGPLIDEGCGLCGFDRVRGGETRISTLEVDKTTSGVCVSSETA